MQESKPGEVGQSSFCATIVAPDARRKICVSSNDGKGARIVMVTRSPPRPLKV
jgi:hypothetical protein